MNKTIDSRIEEYGVFKVKDNPKVLFPSKIHHQYTQTLLPFYVSLKDKDYREKIKVSEYTMDIIVRGVMIFLGEDVKYTLNFILVWTECGSETQEETRINRVRGDIRSPIELAELLGIPVFNLGKPGRKDEFRKYIETY